MRYEKERKYQKVKTTELLDFVAVEIPYEKDKERDKQTDYKDELETREPFADIKMKIDRMDKTLRDLKDTMQKMLKHRHDEQENVTIPVEDAVSQRYF